MSLRVKHIALMGILGCFSHLPLLANEKAFFDLGQPPRNLSDLVQLSDRLVRLAPYTAQRTVAVRQSEGQGSGVIVSTDGRVLTAAHVIRDINRDITLTTFDGIELKAQVLWLDTTLDTGMLKIQRDQEWPHAKLARSSNVRPGTWCIATGHPKTNAPSTSPLIRAGRILGAVKDRIATDTVLTHGDSGGPLFDMNGKLIGIHSRIGPRVADSIHIPVELFVDRTIPPTTESKSTNAHDANRQERVRRFYRGAPSEIGRNHELVRAAFIDLVSKVNQSTARIYNAKNNMTSLGIAVDQTGHVLTKWSKLPTAPLCRFGTGPLVSARFVTGDRAYDVALLKIKTKERLVPVSWKKSNRPLSPGTLLATPCGFDQLPIAIGILSRVPHSLPHRSEIPHSDGQHEPPGVSTQRAGFPHVFDHDSIVPPHLCGGPVVDVTGAVVGINIARASRTSTLAIPVSAAQPLLERLLSETHN